MFERRLKIFLGLLVGVTAVLMLRAAYVQVVEKEHWRAKAEELKRRSRPIDTTRGSILDFRERPIAVDRPCMDVCVTFQALGRPADNMWVRQQAANRLQARLRDGYKELSGSKRKEAIEAEAQQVRSDIDGMWQRLAEVVDRHTNPNASAETTRALLEQIEQTRDEVVKKVLIRRRTVWYRNYQLAMMKYEQREPPPAWRRWLLDDAVDAPTLEKFTIPVAEEVEYHPILKAVANEVQIELRKHIEQYPGLDLRPGVERHYPYSDAGSHVIGNLARVTREDLDADPNVGKDELRQYYPNDQIGRSGVERLAEQLLRGSRGKVETIEGREGEVGRIDFVPGKDVYTTIDIELQYDIANMFHFAKVESQSELHPDAKLPPEIVPMHGAAVLIDVPTGEVRALVSYPTFDLNDYNEKYAERVADELLNPLVNRATELQVVPGSTVKPIAGLGAITDGLIGVNDGIECTGHLVLRGRRISPGFRCWTASKFGEKYPELVAHHMIPSQDQHVGHHGNPNGHLTFTDAVQRSCNVYFENLGDRLGVRDLSGWYYRFGLGRRTGIGLRERAGLLPWRNMRLFGGVQNAWYGAIGQGAVEATPLQMANVAATIARGGIWVRPKLLKDGYGLPSDPDLGPDRVDLGLNPQALAAVKEGMIKVVNSEAGTGKSLHRDDMVVAGKTGTATAGPMRVKKRNEKGEVEIGLDGKPVMELLRPSTRDDPNDAALWYRGGTDGKTFNHAWFIGFAPADDPKVAFAVLIEYGVSGGTAAGSVAREMLEACVERGYLPHKPKPAPAGAVSSSR